MTYSTEERKAYNEKYYADNKQRIAEMLLAKVECPECKKMHSRANLNRHINNKICQRRKQQAMNTPNEMQELRKMVEDLSLKVNSLNA
jgi:hypothetical protein